LKNQGSREIKGGLRDQRGQYLIPKRSETRGLVGIGFLAVALIAGGGPPTYHFGALSDVTHTAHLEAAEATAPLPTLTPVPAIQVEPIVTPVSPVFEGVVTHYGVSYNGSPMGCTGLPYSSENETIIAVGPMNSGQWPCGTQLRVCGTVGCFVGVRQDSCPGCTAYVLDLSEAGITLACGDQAHVCRVGIERVLIEYPPPEQPPAIEVIQQNDPPSEQKILADLGLSEVPVPVTPAGTEPVP
jgi:hypothetical protein